MIAACGRPTTTGGACKRLRRQGQWTILGEWPNGYQPPACRTHMTPEEWSEHERQERFAREAVEALSRTVSPWAWSPVPACWTWPVAEDDRRRAAEVEWFAEWQDGRCAVCGRRGYDHALDHDHETGWVRGFLCRSCNTREAYSTQDQFRRYRKWNPARILGVWERYCSGWTNGPDYGRLNRFQTMWAHPVDSHGTVFVKHRTLADDPAFLVATATAAEE